MNQSFLGIRFAVRRDLFTTAARITCLLAAMSAAHTVFAASQTWTNSASDLQWNTSSLDWTGAAWTNNNDATFGATGVGSIAVASGVVVNDITFSTTNYTLTGNLMLANDQASTFTVNANTTISAIIADNTAGASSLTISGTGALVLSGANTYTGGTTLSGGTLTIGANSTPTTSGTVTSGPLGTGTLTLSGGTLNFNGTQTFTVANAITATAGTTTTVQVASNQNDVLNGNLTGSGNLSQTANGSTGQLQWGGDNSGYTGTYTQNNANTSLTFNSATAGSANANWVFNNPTNQRTRLNFGAGTISFGSLSGNGSIANVAGSGLATVSVGALNSSTTFSGILGATISGQGENIALIKVGTGTLTLTGSNTYTGGTTVNQGTLAYGANFTMKGANQISVAGAGTAGLDYATVTSTGGTLTFTGGTLQINVTASLSGSQSFALFQASGGALAGDFTSVSIAGSYVTSLTDNSGVWTGAANGTSFTFTDSTGILSTSAIPEPSTYAAIVGAIALGLVIIRRRKTALRS